VPRCELDSVFIALTIFRYNNGTERYLVTPHHHFALFDKKELWAQAANSMDTISEHDKFALVQEALAEAQQTVRSYDVKAQIVGVGYIFALGIVFRLGSLLPEVEKDDFQFVIVISPT